MLPASKLAETISSLFIGIIGFVSTMIAQYYGAQKKHECSKAMWQGVYLSIVFSIILCCSAPLAVNLFQMMGHSANLVTYERQMFNLIIISSCLQMFVTAFSSLYRGIGETKIIMYLGIAANLLNVLLDWILIFGKLGMPKLGGIMGSGLATLVSCLFSLVSYLILLHQKKSIASYAVFSNAKFNFALIKKLLKFGLPAGIQSFASIGYFTILLLIIGQTGELNLSCANIAFTIEGISIFPIWGLGAAIGILAGQARGANQIEAIKPILVKGISLGLCFNLIIIFIFNFFPELLISCFKNNSAQEFALIKEHTITLIKLTSIWIIFDSVQIIISNTLRAVGDTLFISITNSILPLIFYIVFPYFILVFLKLPLYWIWIQFNLYALGILAIMSVRFSKNKWQKIQLI